MQRPLEIPNIAGMNFKEYPKVTAIMLTKNNFKYFKLAVDSIIKFGYPNLTLIVGDTKTDDFTDKMRYKKYFSELSELRKDNELIPNIVLVKDLDYHFSKNNNQLVKEYTDESTKYLLFLNNDIELLNNCIHQMVYVFENTEVKNVGTIGCQLLFADRTIQHQGINASRDFNNNFALGHKNFQTMNYKYNIEETLGNTAALMMIKRNLFLEIGGFDEQFKLFQDAKLNIECLVKGHTNLLINHAIAHHFESKTRKAEGRKHLEKVHKDNIQLHQDLFKLQPYLRDNVEIFKKFVVVVR